VSVTIYSLYFSLLTSICCFADPTTCFGVNSAELDDAFVCVAQRAAGFCPFNNMLMLPHQAHLRFPIADELDAQHEPLAADVADDVVLLLQLPQARH